ncbi:hypothetical protein VTO42DRAFT_4531 [Malbranchea cinnamomea]
MSDLTPNQMRGYKAAAHNPRVSDKAKHHAEQILEEHSDVGTSNVQQDVEEDEFGDKDPANVARGLKAAMHNPNVSKEGREEAERKLADMGGD